MKIAILGSARFSASPPFAGGMEMHTAVLGGALAHLGHDVTVYAASGDGAITVRPMRPVPGPEIGRVDVLSDARTLLAETESYLEAVLDLASGDFDVVHVNAVHYVPFACRRLLDGLVTGTLHSPPYPWLARAVASNRSGALPLVAVSSATRAAWGDVEIDVDVIENGVDTAQWPAGPGGDEAVWSGRLVPEKAPHLALEAARRAGLPITLFGPAHDREYFDAEVAPRLDGRARYGGHLPPDQLAAAVGRAGVAVVTPAWDEPFGLVVAEALACGTPVAAFARGALPDLIGDDVGRLAEPGDLDGLAAAMVDATTLDRRRCRRLALRRFSADRMATDYVEWWQRHRAS